MATQTPGRATPNPKYKTYKRGEGGSISGSSGTSTPKASTGGNIGGTFETGVPGYTGYASGAVEQIKTGKADAQGGTVLYSKTYKGGSGTKTTPTGQIVKIQQQPETSYPNVKKTREEMIASSPKLSEQQTKELYNKLQKDAERKTRDENREIIKKQIEETTAKGQRFQRLNYNPNEKTFTIDTENTKTEITEQLQATGQVTQFYAPRTISLSETETRTTPEIFTELDTTDWITPNLKASNVKAPSYASFTGQTSALEAARIKTINYLTLNGEAKENYYSPVVLGISAGFGIVKGSIGATQFIYELPGIIKKDKFKAPETILTGMGEGISQTTETTIKNIATRNAAGISETAGELYAQGIIFGKVSETISPKAILKRQADFAKENKFYEATYSEKIPFDNTPQFNIRGRQGVFTPPEYNAAKGFQKLTQTQKETLLKNEEIRNLLTKEQIKNLLLEEEKAPLLQTQLQAKKVNYDYSQPTANTLQGLSEAGFSNIAKELAIESKNPIPQITLPKRTIAPGETQATFNPQGFKAFKDVASDTSPFNRPYEVKFDNTKEAYNFEAPNPKDKATFQTPPEYTELLGTKERFPKLPEKPQPKSTLEPIENTPGYWLELSKELELKNELNKQIPELQAKLNIEIPPPEQSFTTEQLLEINKQTKQTKLFEIFKGDKSGSFGGRGYAQELQQVQEVPRANKEITDKYQLFKAGSLLGETRTEIKLRNPEGVTFIKTPGTYLPGEILSSPRSKPRLFLPLDINLINQPKLAQINRVIISPIQTQSQSQGQTQSQTLNLRQTQSQSQDLTQRQTLSLRQGQAISQAQAQQITQAQIQAPVLELRPQTKTRQPTRTTNKTEPPTKTPFTPFKPNKKETQTYNSQETFTTEVRKKGKFERISTSKNLFEAVESGLKRTRTTATASFKIRGNKGELISLNQLPSDFTKSKREIGVYIQRKERRISTSGEKSEITNKGIFANKNKQLKGRVNKWEF